MQAPWRIRLSKKAVSCCPGRLCQNADTKACHDVCTTQSLGLARRNATGLVCKQLCQRFAGFIGSHERLSNQKCLYACRTQTLHIGLRCDTTFSDQQSLIRQVLQQLQRGVQRHFKGT